MWLCKCDCGNDFIALGYDLAHGRTTSCGCGYQKIGKPSKRRINLVGKRYGRLTVIELDEEKTKNGTLIWKCKCDCGKIVSASGGNLKYGHTKSCGCAMIEGLENRSIDLTGKRYGRLTVLRKIKKGKGNIFWECQCDCGNTVEVKGAYLRSGNTKSCGCLLEETRRKPKRQTHRMSKTRLYREWSSMHRRCRKEYHESKNYFDKGIVVCEEWGKFEPFSEWAFSNGYSDSLTLDRIDNSKGYSPDNCRWATMKEQQNNRSNNVIIEYMGETKTLKQWCEHFGLNYGMVKRRMANGWEVPKLFEPKHKNQYQ